MEDFFYSLTSPFWWLSVVVVGVLVSVIGAYLKGLIDCLLSFFFNAWKVRVQNKLLKKAKLIEHLNSDDRTLILLGFEENRFRNRSTLFLIIGVTVFLFVLQLQGSQQHKIILPILNIYGGLVMLMGLWYLQKAIYIKNIMYRVDFNPRDYI